MEKKEKSVIISLWSAGSCGRKQLAGILRYVNAGHNWNVRIIMDPRELTPDAVAEAERNGTDGFIAFVPPETEAAMSASRIPTVTLSFPSPLLRRRKRAIAFFVNDNERIGTEGADHFLSLGAFATHVFASDPSGRGWSREREAAFRRRLAQKVIRVLSPPCPAGAKPAEASLADWLKSLPRPVAVMAPYDFGAREAANACKRAGLTVPGDVAILGVDDDELICEAMHPFLTSISIDQEQNGYKAAETLSRLMNARRPPPAETICLPCGNVVERESTRPVSPAIHLVRQIQTAIDDRFREDITADDIVAQLGVSRRLADLRLSQSTGCTVRAALEKRRLDEVMRRLRTSDLPIARITRLCGIANDLWFKYVFKRHTGMTMTTWRQKNRIR